jgi:general secretion pathway protein C
MAADIMGKSLLRGRIAIAAYIAMIAFVLAHTTNAFVADALYEPRDFVAPTQETPGSPPIQETPQEYSETILHSGLFELPRSAGRASAGSSDAPAPPPLEVGKKLALIGTAHGREGGIMAVLEDISTKQQSLYRLGTQVPNVATLAAIEKNRVLFREGEREEWLELAVAKQSQGGALEHPHPVVTAAHTPVPPQRRVLDRREITEALNDPTRLLTQAQAVPFLNDGKLDGFRLYNVMPLGFFDKIGLQTSDILQRINGVELRDPSMVLSLMQQLRNERTVRVELVRNSQRQTLTYEIR